MPAAMATTAEKRDALATQIVAARVEQQAHERCPVGNVCRREAAAEVDRLLDLYPRV